MAKIKKTRHPGLYRLQDGRFRIRATVQCAQTGKMLERQRTLKLGVAEIEALIAIEALRAELRDSNQEEQTRPERPTVAQYAERWIEAKAARQKPSTVAAYEQALVHKILPHLGEIFLDALTRADVEQWVAWAETCRKPNGKPYSKASAMSWWKSLCVLLRDAAAEYDLRDPTRRVRPPERDGELVHETRTLTAEQLASLLDRILKSFSNRYAEIATLALTGMRGGEVYGLHWEDVDLGRKVIQIRRAVWRGKVGTPKTKAGQRQVPIAGKLVPVLRAHRRQQIVSQKPGLDKGIVFPSEVGRYGCPLSLRKSLLKAAKAEGLELNVTAQVLRRTFNTLMMLQGVDRIVLRSMMAHTTERMTEHYAGIGLDTKLAAVELLLGGGE